MWRGPALSVVEGALAREVRGRPRVWIDPHPPLARNARSGAPKPSFPWAKVRATRQLEDLFEQLANVKPGDSTGRAGLFWGRGLVALDQQTPTRAGFLRWIAGILTPLPCCPSSTLEPVRDLTKPKALRHNRRESPRTICMMLGVSSFSYESSSDRKQSWRGGPFGCV